MTEKAPSSSATKKKIRIERNYPASASELWQLWTTSEGIESMWAPDGVRAEVGKLDLGRGGELIYAMTETGAEKVEIMKQDGIPVRMGSRRRRALPHEDMKWMVDNLTEPGGYLLRPAPKHKAEVRGIDGSDWAAR